MISKIDSKAIGIDSQIAPNPIRSRMEEGFEFHSVLKGKLDGSRPIERMVIEFLTRVIESALSERTTEDLFLSPPLPLPVPMKPPVHPSQMDKKPTSEVSENLQENQDFDHIVREAGEKYGVEPPLIKAVIEAESSGNPLAISPAGARGLMQLMPETAAELGVSNSFDPVQNIMAGTRYLRQLLDRYQGNIRLALAAYNWGMGNLENRPQAIPKETGDYITRVENHYRSYMKS